MAEIRSHDFSFDLCVVTKYGVSVGGNNIVAMRPGLGIALRTRRFFGWFQPHTGGSRFRMLLGWKRNGFHTRWAHNTLGDC